MMSMMNTLERYSIPLRQLPSGDVQRFRVFQITGPNPGPHVYIQAGIHGAELQGNLVIGEILHYLKDRPLKGMMTLVPFCNPESSAQKVGSYTYGRFNPITGENWNRSYIDLSFDYDSFAKSHLSSSLEFIKKDFKKKLLLCLEDFHQQCKSDRFWPSENENLCLGLQKLAIPADIVLDLHTGPKSTRYLYAPESRREESQEFHFPYTILIPPVFAGALDEALFVPWYNLEKAFEKVGQKKEFGFSSYTLEFGSEEHINREEAVIDAQKILRYLSFRGMLEQDDALDQGVKNQSCLLENFKTYYCPISGLVEYLKGPGESFVEGETLAKIYRPHMIENFDGLERSIYQIVAKESGIVLGHFPSANVREGIELFYIMAMGE